MSEAQRTGLYLKTLQKLGYWTYKINDRIRSGIPDAVVIKDGDVLFLEFKLGKPEQLTKLVRPAQLYTMERLAKAGASVYVVLFDGQTDHYYEHDLTPISSHPRGTFPSWML